MTSHSISGENILQARLACKKAKPDGLYHLQRDDLSSFMERLPVSDLPSVGRKISKKLSEVSDVTTETSAVVVEERVISDTCQNGVENVSDLLGQSVEWLKDNFGGKMGQMLYEYARGIDKRPLQIFSVSHIYNSPA